MERGGADGYHSDFAIISDVKRRGRPEAVRARRRFGGGTRVPRLPGLPGDGGGAGRRVPDGIAREREGPRQGRGPAAQGDHSAALRGRQVRGDVRAVGRLHGRGRLHAQAGRRDLGARQAAGDQRVVGRRPAVRGVAGQEDRQTLPAADGGRMGIRGPGPDQDTRDQCAVLHRRDHQLQAGQLRRQFHVQQGPAGRLPPEDARRRLAAEERLRPARHARQRVGVGGGLLQDQLRRRARRTARPSQPPIAACASCAAAPGTTIPGFCARPTATLQLPASAWKMRACGLHGRCSVL